MRQEQKRIRGETREEGETRQRQTNESADESLPCAAGRSRAGAGVGAGYSFQESK